MSRKGYLYCNKVFAIISNGILLDYNAEKSQNVGETDKPG